MTNLKDLVDNRKLPHAYFANPVVRENPSEYVLPLGIFLDAVPYSHVDSVIGFWFINLVNNDRYLAVVLRKSQCCICGCRGWCTFHEIFKYLAWSVQALRQKRYFQQRGAMANHGANLI